MRKGDFPIVSLLGGRGKDANAFLRQVLFRTRGWDSLPKLARTKTGKPYFPEHPNLHFSLSHSEDFLLIAIGTRPVGVDIECIQARGERLPRYALTALEYEQYLAMGASWEAFYTLWTKKEAYVKYTGEGLGQGLRKELPKGGVHFVSYAGERFQAALCCEELAPNEILWLKEDGDGWS